MFKAQLIPKQELGLGQSSYHALTYACISTQMCIEAGGNCIDFGAGKGEEKEKKGSQQEQKQEAQAQESKLMC